MRHLIFWAALASSPLLAEDAVTKNLRTHVTSYKENILASLAKLPESDLAFKPAASVMSFQELFGHITDANYSICSQVRGEANPDKGGNAKQHTSKAALSSALEKSFDYCLESATLSDGKLAEQTKARVPRDKAWTALHSLDHMALHYGNIVTYMRIRGLAPGKK